MDVLRPHFSWTPPAGQTGFQIDVLDHNAALVWTSGAVDGSAHVFVPPEPLPLGSDSIYSWTVTVRTTRAVRRIWTVNQVQTPLRT